MQRLQSVPASNGDSRHSIPVYKFSVKSASDLLHMQYRAADIGHHATLLRALMDLFRHKFDSSDFALMITQEEQQCLSLAIPMGTGETFGHGGMYVSLDPKKRTPQRCWLTFRDNLETVIAIEKSDSVEQLKNLVLSSVPRSCPTTPTTESICFESRKYEPDPTEANWKDCFPIHGFIRNAVSKLIEQYNSKEAGLATFDGYYPLPNRNVIYKVVQKALEVLLPGYFGLRVKSNRFESHLRRKISWLHEHLSIQIEGANRHQFGDVTGTDHRDSSERMSAEILEQIPTIREKLSEDISQAFERDPAVNNHDEIAIAYPGIAAVAIHRFAHEIFKMHIPLIPRMMSEYAHSMYGIDIHPGAVIGAGFFIDHGTAVTIGETTCIGRNVTIYQGVTLGALRFERHVDGNIVRGQKRHPTIEDNVTIYSNTSILGGKTVIGRNSTIGANVWLTESILPESVVICSTSSKDIVVHRKCKDSA